MSGIPALARGSGVGTMIGFVLGLSNACPVEYGLLFERFTDPDRSEYPDIDVDICQDGRADVINYVRDKYGYVAQIITFGRLKARAAIKDVARVMGFAPADGQRLANMVPAELNITIDDAIATMITLVTHRDTCCIAANVDRAAVTDPELFGKCLEDGFAEVLALHEGAVRGDAVVDEIGRLLAVAEEEELARG